MALTSTIILLSAGSAKARAEESFTAWVATLWPEAEAAGVSRATFDRVFAGMTPNCRQPDVYCGGQDVRQNAPRPLSERTGLPASCNRVAQREFLQPDKYFPPDRMRRLALRGREILMGLKKKEPQTYRNIVKVEKNFHISRMMLMGLWGRETAFGEARLGHNALQALASSAWAGIKSRRAWNRAQLIAALKMVDQGAVAPAAFNSSYAGATGLTQIMPTEYLSHAMDGDRDGRKDIWASVADSMATTANILKNRGWQTRERSWGYEVMPRASRPLACTLEGSANRWPIRRWVKEFGLKRVPRRHVTRPGFPNPEEEAYLFMPAGARGPSFLVTRNFDVLRKYNPAELYALYVGHLGDRIGCDTKRSECTFRGTWPQPGPDDFEFSVENLCRLQMALQSRGFLSGAPDGLFGPLTRVGIGRYQESRALKPDCYPTKTLFEELINAPQRGASMQ